MAIGNVVAAESRTCPSISSADRSADGFEPPDVLVRGAADLDLGAPETRSLGSLGILNQG
jgi:hypothetical protein